MYEYKLVCNNCIVHISIFIINTFYFIQYYLGIVKTMDEFRCILLSSGLDVNKFLIKLILVLNVPLRLVPTKTTNI